MKTLTLCKTKKFHFITLFNSQEAFFQFMTLVPFVSYTELSVLSKLTLSNKILKLLFPHLYAGALPILHRFFSLSGPERNPK